MANTIDRNNLVVYDDSFFWKLALPQVALPLELAMAAAFLATAGHRLAHAAWVPVAGLLAGFAVWTFFEYAVHRWLFHQTGHPALRWIYRRAHLPHHRTRTMDDPHHRALHPTAAIPALLPHFLAATWLGSAGYLWVMGGFTAGYCFYELFHFLGHGTRWAERFGHLGWVRRKQQAHRDHHFHTPNANFGFTTLFWDHLLGTYVSDFGQARQ